MIGATFLLEQSRVDVVFYFYRSIAAGIVFEGGAEFDGVFVVAGVAFGVLL